MEKSKLLGNVYFRGRTKTIHRLGCDCSTDCGLKITPTWKVVALAGDTKEHECCRCKGGYDSFAERESCQRTSQQNSGRPSWDTITFEELTEEEKRLVLPSLYNPTYHQEKKAELGRLFEERALLRREKSLSHQSVVVPEPIPGHSGYVYLMLAVGSPRYKIGVSVNPPQRLQRLNAGQSPYPLELVYCFSTDDMRRDELMLHEAFKPYRVHGEWYALPPSAVALIKRIKRGQNDE